MADPVRMLKLAEMRQLPVVEINSRIRRGRAFDFVPAFDNPLPSRAPPTGKPSAAAATALPPILEGVHYFCQFNALTGRLAMTSSDEQEVENNRVLAFTGTDLSLRPLEKSKPLKVTRNNIVSLWGHLYILRDGGVLARDGQPDDDQAGQIFFVRDAP